MGIEVGILWLGASVLSTLAIHVASVGLRKLAARLFFAALAMLLVSPALYMMPNTPWRAVALAVTWGLPTLVSTQAARGAKLAGSSPNDERLGKRVRTIGAALWAGAVLNVVLMLVSLAPPSQFLLLIPIVGALLVASCCFAWRVARQHAERGHAGLAGLGRALLLWNTAALILPALALHGSVVGGMALVALGGSPVLTPVLTRVLVGAGPVPLDLEGDFEQPNLKAQRAVLVLLGTAALGLLLLACAKHFARCGGTLELAPAPANWRELPSTSVSDDGGIGHFKLRATRLNYKGYPAEYEHAALGDPGLCFASTVSLGKWFDGDMYRSPSELRLRRSDASGVFIVSAGHDGEPEQLLSAFRRVESQRFAFDSTLSRGFIATGTSLFLLGAVLGMLWLRLGSRQASGRVVDAMRVTAIAAFVASSCTSPLLEERWESNTTPKPGRELAEHYPWLM